MHAPAGAPRDVLLRVLGPLPPAAFLAGTWVELPSRHADILYLLSRSTGGMTADELAQELYGDSGNPLTVRVEMHRIRAILGDRIASAPYRFVVPVGTDADAILALVAQGRVLDAVDRYTGQLLPRSDSLAVELLRAELNQAVRWAVLRAGGPALDRWCAGPVGNSDAEALTARLSRLGPTDPLVPILLARLARDRRRPPADLQPQRNAVQPKLTPMGDVTVGLVVNGASGHDIRRLISAATVVDNSDKGAMTVRLLAGLRAAGVDRVLVMPTDLMIVSTMRRLMRQVSLEHGDQFPRLEWLDFEPRSRRPTRIEHPS